MINSGRDFKNLYDFDYFENTTFKKEVNFRNILNFHIDLITQIIKNSNRNIKDFYFHLVNLVDFEELQNLYNDILENIMIRNYKKEINIPYVVIKFPQNDYMKNLNYDINFFY
jgi:hypothetical protein